MDGDAHFPFRNTLQWPVPAVGTQTGPAHGALWNENIPFVLPLSGVVAAVWPSELGACASPAGQGGAVSTGWAACSGGAGRACLQSCCRIERSWKMQLTSFFPGTPRSLWLGSHLRQGAQWCPAARAREGAAFVAKVGRAHSLPEVPVGPGLAKCGVPDFSSPRALKDAMGPPLERALS